MGALAPQLYFLDIKIKIRIKDQQIPETELSEDHSWVIHFFEILGHIAQAGLRLSMPVKR